MTKFIDAFRYHVPLQPPGTVEGELRTSGKKFVWNAPNHDLVGLELEIENVGAKQQLNNVWWMTVGDGSLRGGLEYKTYPIPPMAVPYALDNLFTFLRKTSARPSFSERTSTHVHVDFRNQTVGNLVNLLLVYLVFEKYLYLYAGPDRYKNNFCIPLSDVTTDALQNIVNAFEKKKLDPESLAIYLTFLSKYSGFNVLPLLQGRVPRGDGHHASGSIEFRHMAGTPDQERIITWVSMLQYLKDYAIKTEYEAIKEQIVTLNTTSHYQEFATDVFGPYGNLLLPLSLDWKLLSSSLALTKQAFAKQLPIKGTEFLKSPLAIQLQAKHDKVAEPKKDEPAPARAARGLGDFVEMPAGNNPFIAQFMGEAVQAGPQQEPRPMIMYDDPRLGRGNWGFDENRNFRFIPRNEWADRGFFDAGDANDALDRFRVAPRPERNR